MTSPLLRTSALGLACALGALACSKGGNNGNQPPPPPTTGTGGSGGTGISTGTGGVPPPPPPPSGMVTIMIQQPTAGLVAPAGSLVAVRVTATVDQGTDVIDPTSVEATVTAKGDSAPVDSTMLAPQGMDVYGGRLSIGDRPTGDYTLTVTGASSGGMKGTASIDFQIDGGPLLFVRTPQPLHSYKDLLVIEVVADPGPFGPLDGPHATVANYPVQLDPVPGVDNTYRGMLDLNNPAPGMIVEQLIDQQLLTVWATNANGKRVDIHLVFIIDESGPTITKTTPAAGQIVGDIMTISASISDPSGVLDSSVIAVIGDDTHPALFNVQLKPDGLGSYSVLFDTRRLTGCDDPPSASNLCIVYPSISFRASDELGNESVVAYDFVVDNIAPVADLDPPKLRSFRFEETEVCSWEFDPLANNTAIGDMPNDKAIVPQVFDLRARIEDDGNHAVGLKVTPISLVDPDKTAVYVLDDTSKALIVDTDNDGWCDSINPLLVPTTEPPTDNNQVLKIRLAPVAPGGVANFTPDGSLPPTAGTQFCRSGTDGLLPPLLCPGNQPTIAIGYVDGLVPAIWSLEHINLPPAAWCFGQQFDAFANNIAQADPTIANDPNGWACIAVQTTDMANNTGVSAPLRVYIKYGMPDTDFGKSGPGTPPACTGIYDRTSNTVTNGACKTRRFERQPKLEDYYCYKGNCPGPFLPL